jgi:hypothetical protein
MKTLKLVLELLSGLLEQIPRRWFLFAAIVFVAFYGIYDSVFSHYFSEHRTWYNVIVLALVMLLPASTLYVLPHFVRELRLLKQADHPQLIDGRRIAVHGTLESQRDLIVTPFTERLCCCYDYRIYHFEKARVGTTGGDDGREAVSDFVGFAKVPFVLRSSIGDLQLLNSIAATETCSFRVKDPAYASKVNAFVDHTVFEESWDTFTATKERGDFRRPGASLDVAERVIEGCIPPGAEICILGRWSSSPAGIQSVGSALGSYTVVKGNPANAARAIVQRILKNIVMSIFLAAIINVFAVLILWGH